MRGAVDVPLVTIDGRTVGKVRVSKSGFVKIEMSEWVQARDMVTIVAFIHFLTSTLTNHPLAHSFPMRNQPPPTYRRYIQGET